MAAICRSTIIKERTPLKSEWALRSLRNDHAVYVGMGTPLISEWLRRSAGICRVNYHKLADMGTYLQSIDEWMRRRIRMVFWKKWKRVRTRWRNLLKLGISYRNAGILANSRKGYWWIAASPILKTALSNLRLEKAGFQFFCSYYRKSVAA